MTLRGLSKQCQAAQAGILRRRLMSEELMSLTSCFVCVTLTSPLELVAWVSCVILAWLLPELDEPRVLLQLENPLAAPMSRPDNCFKNALAGCSMSLHLQGAQRLKSKWIHNHFDKNRDSERELRPASTPASVLLTKSLHHLPA